MPIYLGTHSFIVSKKIHYVKKDWTYDILMRSHTPVIQYPHL